MNAVRDDVMVAIEKELTFANTKFPLFTTAHEGIAVIKEEQEEVADAYKELENEVAIMWRKIKNNSNTDYIVEQIYKKAVHVAVEAIQTAAMASKFFMSFDKEDKDAE